MRIIVTLIFVGLIGWCVWWFVGSQGQHTAWTHWFEDRKAAGWVAEATEVEVNGFPNRFDTTLTGIQLADPQSGWAWSAPFFQVLMLSYKPNHIIAVWPDTQKVSGLGDTATITSDLMRGSVVFAPNTDLTLDRTQIEISNLGLLASSWTANLKSANLATRRLDPEDAPDFAHQIGFDAQDLTLAESIRRQIDPAGILPEVMERAHVDLVAAFDAPWDRHSIEGAKPQPTAFSVKDISVRWGKLELNAKGQITVSSDGYPEGNIKVKARNWQDMLQVAIEGGLIDRDIADGIRSGLDLMAMLSGDRDTLDVPLSFSDGYVKLGPIPLGPAPILRFR